MVQLGELLALRLFQVPPPTTLGPALCVGQHYMWCPFVLAAVAAVVASGLSWLLPQ